MTKKDRRSRQSADARNARPQLHDEVVFLEGPTAIPASEHRNQSSHEPTEPLKVNPGRLRTSIAELARIGGTALGGVSRLALANKDREARDLLVRWMEETGLEVRFDDVGNLYGKRPGTDPGLPPVVLGSHLDSVIRGGKYDGALGVLAALEVLRRLGEEGVRTHHPVEMASFTNEEGARFTPAMLGSGTVAGVFSKEYVYGRRDPDGVCFEEELRRIGYRGNRENRIDTVAAYLELHIEQGPYLEDLGVYLGLVEGIVCDVWLEAKVAGQSDHAGPTPMHLRRDAMVAAARMIEAVRDIACSTTHLVGTVGRVNPSPNIVNVVPGEVEFTVDFRHASEEMVNRTIDEFREQAARIAREEGVEFTVSELWRMSPTRFSPEVLSEMEDICEALGYPKTRMVSAAGHDSRYLSLLGDTAMIFVQTKDGKSHCEEEEAPWDGIEQAANVLLNTTARLAMRGRL